MEELDLMTKFNRGVSLGLVDENVYEAVQLYRQYISYLHSKDSVESYKKELIEARNAFLIKLNNFVNDEKNKKNIQELIPAYQELITAYPNFAKFYIECAKCFSNLEQYDIALELLKKAQTIEPLNNEIKEEIAKNKTKLNSNEIMKKESFKDEELSLMTRFNRGLCLSFVEKDIYEAVQFYREYLSYLQTKTNEAFKKEVEILKYEFLEKLKNFNENSYDTKDLIIALQELINLEPENKEYYIKAALCFKNLKQYDISLELLKKAESIDSFDICIKENILEISLLSKDFKGAKKYAQNIIEGGNQDAIYFCNLARACFELYNENLDDELLKKAVLNMEIARKKDEKQKIYLKNLMVLYLIIQDNKKLDELWTQYLKTFKLDYSDTMDYAMYLLRKGDYKKGFEIYEKRLSFDENSKLKNYPDFKKPKYNNEKKPEKTILIQHEQGFGDTIMFCRFIPSIKTGKTILRVPYAIYDVMKRNFPSVEIIKDDTDISSLKFDYHLPLMSIPYILNFEQNKVCGDSYLRADIEKVKEFKNLFNEKTFKIGISYQGSNKTGNLKTRDIDLEQFKKLADIKGAEIYSLQYGVLDTVFKNTKIKNLSPYIKTFDDTMALIENMDLIISTDNVILNLAGAMGKKTFGLFNFIPEWRWFDLTKEDVIWYKSVKPYKAEKQNDWNPVIKRVISDIEKLRG